MALLISVLSFVFLTTAIVFYAHRFYLRPGRVYEQLGDNGRPAAGGADVPAGAAPMLVQVIRQIGEKVPVSPMEATLTRRYLMAAGFRADHSLSVYYGAKVVLLLVMLICGFLLRENITANRAVGWVIVGAAGLLGWFAPVLLLESLVSKRQNRLRFSLPDALDMMVVCVEAGHALDQAFIRVSKELKFAHPDICEEFALVNLEMRAGKKRAEALHNLAERTGEREIQKLVAIMIQADRFGTSIADSLRVHADFLRVRRRQEAEERAGKIGVKLIFPIFFFILPSMFLVTAGPAIIQVMKYLLPTLKQAAGK